MNQDKKKKNRNARVARIMAKIVLYTTLFFLVILLLLQTGPVQNLLRKKIVAWLETRLDTKVEVRSMRFYYPSNIVLQDIYVEDRQKDTLLSGGRVDADIKLWQLITQNETIIESISFENITAKIRRDLPDTQFNFQFIVDAFAPRDSVIAADTSGSAITLRALKLDKVRLLYKDIVTGSDVVAWVEHLDARIDYFDPARLQFDVPQTTISGLIASVNQSKPLATPEPEIKDSLEAMEPIVMQLAFNELDIRSTRLTYNNDVSATYGTLAIGSLLVKPNGFDFTNRVIDLQDLVLQHTGAVFRLGQKQEARVVEEEVEQELESQAKAGWRISIENFDLAHNHFQFDNDNKPRANAGMDYSHLKADSLTLKGNNFLFSRDTISGSIAGASFKEQSGFILNNLETGFFYSEQGSRLEDLFLKTPGTELKRSAAIEYASLESLANDIGNMQVDLDLQDSKLLVKDLLTFVPSLQNQPAFAYPGATWYINSRISGRLADLRIDELQIQGLNNTRIDIAGQLGGLPDLKHLSANLSINNISSSRRDIALFIPLHQLPGNINFPDRFSASGRLQGHSNHLNTDLSIATNLGFAGVHGSFGNIGDPVNAVYDAIIQTRGLQLGTIIQNPELKGPLNSTITVKGKGLTKTASAVFNASIHSFAYNQYVYRNLKVKGSLDRQQLVFDAGIRDPNIHFAIEGRSNLAAAYPSLILEGMIDSLKFQPLQFTSQPIIFRGKLDANFSSTNPDQPEGELFLTQVLLVQNTQRLPLDTVQLLAGRSDTGQYIRLYSDVMNAELEGQYRLSQLGTVFQQAVQPYFAFSPGPVQKVQRPYDFTLNAYAIDNPALKVFIPGLEKMDSVFLQSHFTNNGWTAQLDAPTIDMGPNKIRGLKMQAGTTQEAIVMNATLQQFSAGENIKLDNTTLTASLANNSIDFTLNNKDRNARDKYFIKGIVHQPRPGEYQVSLKPDSLVLNYDAWAVSPNNQLRITRKGVYARDFVLSNQGQQLTLNSKTANSRALQANFTNFQLATITGFIQTDSTFANGLINGNIVFTDIIRDPAFEGDLAINDFSFKGDTVGHVHALINSRVAGVYATDITLKGRGNDLKVTGNYFMNEGGSRLDLVMDIRSLPLTTAQAFSNNLLSDATGDMNGRLTLKGSLPRPLVNGELNFNKAGFTFSMLNSYFTIDQERIQFVGDGLRFNRFEIKDSAQNSLIINGIAATTDYSSFNFDLDITADNFRVLNSTKRQNDIFYGKFYFTTNLRVRGTESSPTIDGNLTVNENTRMTFVLPQREPGIVERDGIIEFVDLDAPLNDSLFLAAYDSLNISRFRGLDIAVNIEIVKDAEFNLIIDEGNGDFLNVKGEALLTGGIDPSGKIQLSGSYELDQGAYELSFNFLRRRFNIEKGSRIVWEGLPTEATVDVKAIYVANAAPLDLVKSQLEDVTAYQRNTYLQRLPFDVHLDMQGELLKPQIEFDIILPEKAYVVSGDIITNVRTRLDQIRQDPGEMNKQVFSLLLLNRFMSENPFNVSSAGPRPGTLARQSVSKLLTEQLNRLAGELIAGVNLNFDVLSTEDYTTGERRDRTDLNVQLSKRLLNDRLNVTIGSNFELEGPNQTNQASNIAGNVALDYRISRDNRYMLRAYRKNEYEGIIDGYIIETGVGFIITVDYNRFRQLFVSRKEREERRKRRQQQRELNEQQKIRTDSTGSGPRMN